MDFGELNAFRGRPLSSRRRNIALDEWDDEGGGGVGELERVKP